MLGVNELFNIVCARALELKRKAEPSAPAITPAFPGTVVIGPVNNEENSGCC